MNSIPYSHYKGKRIAVGLSGGVDSSTVLALLKEAGADVCGLTMSIYRKNAEAARAELPVADACYGPGEVDDIESAGALCASLGVPYHVLDLAAEYEAAVLDYFRTEYKAGRTPNPCVRCNQTMKFGFLLDKARKAGVKFDFFATGHYARIESKNAVTALRQGKDSAKDQSYFIHRLPQTTLAMTLFPLGSLTKAEVRAEARRLGLAAAEKPESQDFVAGGYASLFDDTKPGDIVTDTGRVIGRHRGIVHYTIGQRRGLGVSIGPEALYVSAIDAAANKIIVSSDESLLCRGIEGCDAAASALLLSSHCARENLPDFEAFVRIRQNHRPARARVSLSGDRARIYFDDMQRAAAPGQSAVWYDDEGFVLGACIIASSFK